uniref:Probable ATP-dependent RNA helicase DDX46 n=1 Tax=Panagrellus redivivus TaxID=6233 RepID=A0A7E4VVU6_PANRE
MSSRDKSSSSRSSRDEDRREKRSSRRRDERRSETSKRRSRSRSPLDPHSPVEASLTDIITSGDIRQVNQQMELMAMRKREEVEAWRQTKQRDQYQKDKDKKAEKESEFDDELEEVALAVDEDDDDVQMESVNHDSDDEEDPLDAYMKEVEKQAAVAAVPAPVQVGPGGMIVVEEQVKPGRNLGEIIEREDIHEEVEADDFDIEEAASSLLSKGRSLQKTDHSMVYYKPFRKDFYHEAEAIKNMTKKEVAKWREDHEGIRIRGAKCPKPIMSWAQAGVSNLEMKLLAKLGYTKPTPIQSQAVPAILSGRDVIGIAKTGSGKTLAFLLPMFRHILDQEELDELDGPIALIMAPTRELALQTWREATKFATPMKLRVVCVYGGVGISEQIADLKRGAEIVVCTAGRMIDMLVANNGRVTNLRRCTYLVMDEADRMFDMGFEPQVMKIINNIRPDRQTVMFSATFPKTMEALARKVLDKPIEIQVGGRSVVCKDIEQNALILTEDQKFLKLLELLGLFWEKGSTIVFVDKQEKADDLVSRLMKSGYNCAPLHGGIDQSDRDSALIDFKQGAIKLLIATSVAARGLDVKKLILVVNYDCPNHYEDYVHRVGRTGRAGNKGYAYTFLLPEGQERYAGEVVRAFETADVEAPAPVKALWEKYREDMRAQGIEVHTGGGGFTGHGYKYDSDEDEAVDHKKKFAKLVTSMENQDDDDDIEAQLSNLIKTTRRSRVNNPGKDGASGGKSANEIDAKVAAARAVADKLGLASNSNEPESSSISQTATSIMRGEAAAPLELSAAQIARQRAQQLNEKLNYTPSAKPKEQAPVQQYFEEELEINDFPQQLRFRVCSRESMAQIQEFADVGISVKGTHVPPGREPKDGERKLYLFLEARDEISLRRAREEMLRIMKDCLRQMTSRGRPAPSGRYRVA